MKKFMITVPVNGSLNIVIESKNEADAIDYYMEHKEKYLKSSNLFLDDDFENSFITELNQSIKC